jgi:hypothetical protein
VRLPSASLFLSAGDGSPNHGRPKPGELDPLAEANEPGSRTSLSERVCID